MKLKTFLAAALLIAAPAFADEPQKAQNPDGGQGTVWLDFGAETALDGEHKLDGDSSPVSGKVNFNLGRIGVGCVLGPRATLLLYGGAQRSVYKNANYSQGGSFGTPRVDQTSRIYSAGFQLRIYLNVGSGEARQWDQ